MVLAFIYRTGRSLPLQGVVFIPFHFAGAAANVLTSIVLDPYAKMAELKSGTVRIEANES